MKSVKPLFPLISIDQEMLERIQKFGKSGSPIGEIHIPGDWNKWGYSAKSPGCIRPLEETRLEEEGGYSITVNVSSGIHRFKLAIVRADPDADGMCPAEWIECPPEGVGKHFRRASKHGNWEIVIGR